MKIAILSDIHSNLQALQAVFKDIKKLKVDKIITLGDIIGYGADPSECLDMVTSDPRLIAKIQGNHEDALVQHAIGGEDIESWMNRNAWQGLMHSYKILGDEKILGFADWPEIATLPEFGITLAHGSVASSHVWNYVDDHEKVKMEFARVPSKICFIGHTHYPNLIDDKDNIFHYYVGRPHELQTDRNYLINVGSVGQPRKGDYRSCYGILQISKGVKSFMLRRVEYDIDGAVQAIRRAGLPEFLADRLRKGI